jgi:hypothetical protein
MSHDILSLNKTTKSILKNPDPKASLAYSNAILRKDPAKVNIEGIGLNPNIQLEDEYISNLQKQIHFMDLEIKLMKEKQTQEEALGGNYQFAKIGINDGKFSMDHIMTTTNKFQQMKGDMTKQINLLEQDLMRNREENTIIHAKVANLERHVVDYDEKLTKVLHENSQSLNEMRNKLLAEKKQREDCEVDMSKMKPQLDKILHDNAELRRESEIKEINDRLNNKRVDEDEALDKETLETKKKLIDELQMEKARLLIVTEKDPRLQALREDNERFIKDLKDSEKKVDDANYKVLETETRQLLSVRKKDEDQDARKKLQQELEKWRDQLEETTKSNELKVERKIREAESAIIRELQAELLKERTELGEFRNKFENVANKEREYILDQANRERHRADLEVKKTKNLATIKDLRTQIEDLDPKVNDMDVKVDDLRLKLTDKRELRAKLQLKLKEVEEENIILLSKFTFLQHNIKLEDDMKKFNIEDLRRVTETNKNVNETIKNFMDKWDTLKKFSKMQ